MMTVICTFPIPVLWYTFGIIKWTKTKLQRLDKETQKLLTINGMLHPKSSVACLYLHQTKGGRGLTGVEETHKEECSALAKYVMRSADPLTRIMGDTPPPTQKHLMWYATMPWFSTPDKTDVAHHRMLHNKLVHGSWFCQQAEVPQVDLD
eukprot:14704001-Ditylum_brightwellii.AAC.1